MSIEKQRNGFFRSSGSAAGPGFFDAYWTDTSQAVVLPGAWDNPSGSADAQFSVIASVAAYPATKRVLVAQFVMPPFGATMDFSAPTSPTTVWTFFHRNPCWMAKKTSITGTINAVTNCVAYVVTSGNVFRYYLFQQLQAGNGGGNSGVLKGVFASNSGGTNFPTSTYSPVSSDKLIVEVGVFFTSGSSFLGAVGNATLQYGDAHPVYDAGGSSIAGNSGAVVSWFGNPVITAGHPTAKFLKPLSPVRNAILTQFPAPPDPPAQSSGANLNNMFLGSDFLNP